jgi:hypothetical protein
MRMMKKIALFLLIITIFLLFGCSSEKKNNSTKDSSNETDFPVKSLFYNMTDTGFYEIFENTDNITHICTAHLYHHSGRNETKQIVLEPGEKKEINFSYYVGIGVTTEVIKVNCE